MKILFRFVHSTKKKKNHSVTSWNTWIDNIVCVDSVSAPISPTQPNFICCLRRAMNNDKPWTCFFTYVANTSINIIVAYQFSWKCEKKNRPLTKGKARRLMAIYFRGPSSVAIWKHPTSNFLKSDVLHLILWYIINFLFCIWY